MKIVYKDWYSGRPVEVTSVESFVERYVEPWDHRGSIEDTEHRVEKLQELVTKLIEVTATKFQLDATDLTKIFESHVLDVQYETEVE